MTQPPSDAQRVAETLRIKPFIVNVVGWPDVNATYYATSCARALADAWRCDAFGGYTFGQFLKIARAYSAPGSDRFGEPLTVNGKPAFYIEHNRAYIRIAYPGDDCVHNAHPMEVEPPEARRGTPYYVRSELIAKEDHPLHIGERDG